nr:unnamed protein product [Digitaria exilis]
MGVEGCSCYRGSSGVMTRGLVAAAAAIPLAAPPFRPCRSCYASPTGGAQVAWPQQARSLALRNEEGGAAMLSLATRSALHPTLDGQ